MTITQLEERVRAKRLAERAGMSDHPWPNAEKDLNGALDVQRQREAAEAERRKDNEAEMFRRALSDYTRLVGELSTHREAELRNADELSAFGPDAPVVHQRVLRFKASPSGAIWHQEHGMNPKPLGVNAPIPPRGDPPPGLTWDAIDLASRYHEKLVARDQIRSIAGSVLMQLGQLETEWLDLNSELRKISDAERQRECDKNSELDRLRAKERQHEALKDALAKASEADLRAELARRSF